MAGKPQDLRALWTRKAERLLPRILIAARIRSRVGVRVVGQAEMVRLNAQYRGKRQPTDVLSFPAHDLLRRRGDLGDLVICLPVLTRQARSLGHSPATELQVLLVHGVLHLKGYDHELGSKEALRMARAEARLLGRLAKHGLIARAAGIR